MAETEIVSTSNINEIIGFLAAMVTPALLISATGSLVLSTSTRLGRIVDRVRQLEDRLSALIYSEEKESIPLYDKRVEVVVDLLDKVTSRSRILQRAMGAFYYGLMFFILTSVSIALVGLLNIYLWLPIPLGVVGIMFLFYGSLLMLRETRMAAKTVNTEMDFTWELARKVAPESVAVKYARRGKHGGMAPAKLTNVTKVSKTTGDG